MDLHPSSSAGDGRRFRQRKLLAPREVSESRFISCPHCGWHNDSSKRARPDPNGLSNQIVTTSIAIPGGTRTFYESIRTAGCSHCGLDFTMSSYKQPFFSNQNLQGR